MSEEKHNEPIKEQVDGQAEAQESVSPDEDRARRMGWVDKDEFHGPEARWVSADEFIERSEQNPNILRERYETLDSKFSALQGDVKALIGQLGEKHAAEHKRSLDYAKRTRDKAAEDGDAETYKQYDAAYEELREAAKAPDNEADTEFAAFQAQHGWYNDDLEKTVYADQIAPVVVRKNPLWSRAQVLAEVGRITEQKFPAVNERRARAGAVEGGAGAKSKHKKGFDDLPTEAKEAIERFTKRGLDRKELVASYVGTYFGE